MSQAESERSAELNAEGASSPSEKAAPLLVHASNRVSGGSCGWFLPTLKGPAWFVLAETDAEGFARSASERALVLYAADREALACKEQVQQGMTFTNDWLSDERNEAWFKLARHGLLAVGLVLIALVGLRVPGKFKILDDLLLLFGLGYLVFSVRRGWRAIAACTEHLRVARKAFEGPRWSAHPLLERLAAALAFRSGLTMEKRGHNPDGELLDRDAYRKLIDEGIVSSEELAALGRAITARLGLIGQRRSDVKITELARAAGLDDETAAFYFDLARGAEQFPTNSLEHLVL